MLVVDLLFVVDLRGNSSVLARLEDDFDIIDFFDSIGLVLYRDPRFVKLLEVAGVQLCLDFRRWKVRIWLSISASAILSWQ